MAEFLKSFANIIILAVTILGVFAIIFKTLEIFESLILLAILLFLGFISLVIYQINKNSKEIKSIKQNFKINERLNKLELKVFRK